MFCDSILIFTSLLSIFLTYAIFDSLQKLSGKALKEYFNASLIRKINIFCLEMGRTLEENV